jgi:hypothetical protein
MIRDNAELSSEMIGEEQVITEKTEDIPRRP